MIDQIVKIFTLPFAVAEGLFKSYFLMIFAGGLIFFLLNTPQDKLVSVVDAFKQGEISGSIDALVDASIAFGENISDKFNREELSDTVVNSIEKMKPAAERIADE